MGHRLLIGILWVYGVGGPLALIALVAWQLGFAMAGVVALLLLLLLVVFGRYWLRGPVHDDPVLDEMAARARERRKYTRPRLVKR